MTERRPISRISCAIWKPTCRCFASFRQFRLFSDLARADSHFGKATELFDSLVTIPLESDLCRAICLRYFQIRKTWDLQQYAAVTEADLIFRNQARRDSPGSASNISIAVGKMDA